MFKIRKAPRKIYPQIKVLCDDLIDDDGVSAWKAGAEYWIAEDSDTKEIVAYAGLVRSTRYTDVVYFHAAGVVQKAQGHKLQRRLIRARLRWAKDHGFSWATTDTIPSNVPSAKNLIACGFRPYWPLYRWRASGACYWSKKL